MAFQIFNDGAVVRIDNGTKTLLVTKEQVKTIDTIRDNIVRIDIGEGPLKNIFINYQDVIAPVVTSANELRDLIKGWLLSDNYNGGDATEVTQLAIVNRLGDVASVLDNLLKIEKDLTRREPSRMDESNPYTIYKGWHLYWGGTFSAEWAIQRIRREDDNIIYEWANGKQDQIHIWDERESLNYIPHDYVSPSVSPPGEGPNPIVPDYNPPAEGPNGNGEAFLAQQPGE